MKESTEGEFPTSAVDPNPYAPPRAKRRKRRKRDLRGEPWEIATYGQRAIGALVDGVCVVGAALLASYAAVRFGHEQTTRFAAFAGMLAYGVVNAYFIHTSGQTLGKRFAMTRMVLRDGAQAPLWRVIVLRWLIISIATSFLPAVSVIDAVFMFFGSERRCLHDHLAGTYVVKATAR